MPVGNDRGQQLGHDFFLPDDRLGNFRLETFRFRAHLAHGRADFLILGCGWAGSEIGGIRCHAGRDGILKDKNRLADRDRVAVFQRLVLDPRPVQLRAVEAAEIFDVPNVEGLVNRRVVAGGRGIDIELDVALRIPADGQFAVPQRKNSAARETFFCSNLGHTIQWGGRVSSPSCLTVSTTRRFPIAETKKCFMNGGFCRTGSSSR